MYLTVFVFKQDGTVNINPICDCNKQPILRDVFLHSIYKHPVKFSPKFYIFLSNKQKRILYLFRKSCPGGK